MPKGKKQRHEANPEAGLVASKTNALESLYNFYIKESNGDPIPFGKWEKFSLVLEGLGGSGGIYSWPPAKAYGEGKPLWLSLSLQITNPLSNVLFLVNATDNLLNSVAIEVKCPEQLADMLKLPTTCELISKYTKMLAGTMVCSVPFVIVTYMFPLPFCKEGACMAVMLTHSAVANTILHGISWNFILSDQYWYYRLPVIPFEKLYQVMRESCLSDEQKELRVIKQRKQAIYQKYRDHFSQFFVAGAERIVKGKIENPNQPGTPAVRLLTQENYSLPQYAKLIKDNTPQEVPSESRIAALGRSVHRFLSNGAVGFAGAAFMVVGCVGLISNPYYIFSHDFLFNLWETVGLASLPAYSTAVLCAFYGAATMNQIYDYLTSWQYGLKGKLSYEARMYPVSFTIFLMCNIYISAFAFGTAQELIETVFGAEMWEDFRPFFSGVAIPAFQILSFVPLLDLFNTFVRKSVAKFGDKANDNTMAARLLEKSSVIGQRVQQLRGSQLMSSLTAFTGDQLNAMNVNVLDLQTDLDALDKLSGSKRELKAKMAKESYSLSFWGKEKLKERTPLLINDGEGPSYDDHALPAP